MYMRGKNIHIIIYTFLKGYSPQTGYPGGYGSYRPPPVGPGQPMQQPGGYNPQQPSGYGQPPQQPPPAN